MTNEQIEKQKHILNLLNQVKVDLANLRSQVKSIKIENEVEDFFKLP